jgi:hypothetical protein
MNVKARSNDTTSRRKAYERTDKLKAFLPDEDY